MKKIGLLTVMVLLVSLVVIGCGSQPRIEVVYMNGEREMVSDFPSELPDSGRVEVNYGGGKEEIYLQDTIVIILDMVQITITPDPSAIEGNHYDAWDVFIFNMNDRSVNVIVEKAAGNLIWDSYYGLIGSEDKDGDSPLRLWSYDKAERKIFVHSYDRLRIRVKIDGKSFYSYYPGPHPYKTFRLQSRVFPKF